MIEERAEVIEIKGDKLLLQAQVQSACGGCAVNKGCGTSVLSKVVGRKFTQFQAVNSVNAKIGDTVVVGIAEDVMVKGSLMIYIVPLLAMLVFAVLADYAFAEQIGARDALIAAFSIAGLATGALVSRWYFGRQTSGHLYSPVVLRKIIEHGKIQVES